MKICLTLPNAKLIEVYGGLFIDFESSWIKLLIFYSDQHVFKVVTLYCFSHMQHTFLPPLPPPAPHNIRVHVLSRAENQLPKIESPFALTRFPQYSICCITIQAAEGVNWLNGSLFSIPCVLTIVALFNDFDAPLLKRTLLLGIFSVC